MHRCLLEPIHQVNRNLAIALSEIPADSPLKLMGYWPKGNVPHETVNADAEVAFRVDLAAVYCKHVLAHARMLTQLALLAAPRADYPKHMKPLENGNMLKLFSSCSRFAESATLILKKLFIDQEQINRSDPKLIDYDSKKKGGFALLTK